MPSDLDSDGLERSIIAALRDVSVQLGAVRAEIKEDTAQLLRSYREDVHRSIMAIHVRIVSLEDTYENDRAARMARQKTLDGRLDTIQHNQRAWIRFVMFAAIIAIGIAIGIWVF